MLNYSGSFKLLEENLPVDRKRADQRVQRYKTWVVFNYRKNLLSGPENIKLISFEMI